MKENDKVKIMDTGDVGYIEKVTCNGERLMVRVPSSDGWPFPHHVYVDREKVHRINEKPEPKKTKPIDWRAPF